MILNCMFALLLRPESDIGKIITTRDIYHTESTDHCMELTIRLGSTYLNWEVLNEAELPMEECEK